MQALLIAIFAAVILNFGLLWTHALGFMIPKNLVEGVATAFFHPCRNAIAKGIDPDNFDASMARNAMAEFGGGCFFFTAAAVVAYYAYPDLEYVFVIFTLVPGVLAFGSVFCITDYAIQDSSARGSMMLRKARKKKAIFANKVQVAPLLESDLEGGPEPAGGGNPQGRISIGATSKLMQARHRMQNVQIEEESAADPFWDFLKRPSISLLLLTTLILHFANGGIFPLMLLVVAEDGPGRDAMTFAASIFAVRMVFDYIGASSYQWVKSHVGGAKNVMILAILTTATVRALIMSIFLGFGAGAVTENRYAHASTVVLEGLGTGWSMLGFQVLFEVAARDTGRFGLDTSLFFAMVHLGAGLSVTIGGFIFDASRAAAFIFFAVVSLIAVAVFHPAYETVMLQDTNRAATKIQAGFRGLMARKRVAAMKAEP